MQLFFFFSRMYTFVRVNMAQEHSIRHDDDDVGGVWDIQISADE